MYVKTYWDSLGYAPSVREVADELGIAPSAAHYHLNILREQGLLLHTEGAARTWRPR